MFCSSQYPHIRGDTIYLTPWSWQALEQAYVPHERNLEEVKKNSRRACGEHVRDSRQLSNLSHKDLVWKRKIQSSSNWQERQSRLVCTGKLSMLPSMSLTTARRMTGQLTMSGEPQRLLACSLAKLTNNSSSNKHSLFPLHWLYLCLKPLEKIFSRWWKNPMLFCLLPQASLLSSCHTQSTFVDNASLNTFTITNTCQNTSTLNR